jgi:hypothetical protein
MVIHPLQGDDRFISRCREAKVDCLRQIFIIEKTVRSTALSHPQFEQAITACLQTVREDRSRARLAAADACNDLRWHADTWQRRLQQAEMDAQCMVDTLEGLLTYQRVCDLSTSLMHAGSYFATIRLLTHQFFWIYGDLAQDLAKSQAQHFRNLLPSPSRCRGTVAGWYNHYPTAARSFAQKRNGFAVSSSPSMSFQESRAVAATGT